MKCYCENCGEEIESLTYHKPEDCIDYLAEEKESLKERVTNLEERLFYLEGEMRSHRHNHG